MPAIIYWEVEKELLIARASRGEKRPPLLRCSRSFHVGSLPFTIFIDTKCENSSPCRRHHRASCWKWLARARAVEFRARWATPQGRNRGFRLRAPTLSRISCSYGGKRTNCERIKRRCALAGSGTRSREWSLYSVCSSLNYLTSLVTTFPECRPLFAASCATSPLHIAPLRAHSACSSLSMNHGDTFPTPPLIGTRGVFRELRAPCGSFVPSPPSLLEINQTRARAGRRVKASSRD